MMDRYCFVRVTRLWVCTSLKIVRFTFNKDQNVQILRQVCLLCLALQIFLFNVYIIIQYFPSVPKTILTN